MSYGNAYGFNSFQQPMYVPANRPQPQSFNQMANPTAQYFPMVTQPVGLRGRTVNTPDEITPQEVPMDGGYSFFPLADNSAVYMKAWTPDGKINTFKFIPESIELPIENIPDTSTAIMERLDRIEGMLKQHNNHRNNQKYNKQEKEDDNE